MKWQGPRYDDTRKITYFTFLPRRDPKTGLVFWLQKITVIEEWSGGWWRTRYIEEAR